MTDFISLPAAPALRLLNATVPGWLLGRTDSLLRTELAMAGGRLADPAALPEAPAVDLRGAMVFPCFIDMHTHLDKGHIWPRSPNPDGTFMGALTTVAADRTARWSAEDVRARAEFALRCAHAHGTRAVRTHLDSIPPQDAISWPVFRDLRTDWAGRIDLQAVCLVGADGVEPGGDGAFAATARRVAEAGGVLGMVTYPLPDLKDRLLAFFRLAEAHGLAADFHTDETLDPASNTLRTIAETVLETGFAAPVTVGHCCSLSTMPEGAALATLDLVAQAGIGMVSLPMCNLYLQDRQPRRTPRYRGITLVHEAKARAISVAFASDNTRDPFYAYGDLDMIEVMREAARIGHLDHADRDWTRAFLANPAQQCGFSAPSLAAGAPADLVIVNARTWSELFARPQADRVVLRAGRAICRRLPDYAELDHLMDAR